MSIPRAIQAFHRLVCIALVFCLASTALAYEVVITQEKLQAKLDAMMPIERKEFILAIVISEPKLELLAETNEVAVGLNVSATAPGGLRGAGKGRLRGEVRYASESGAFFIDRPVLETLEIERVPQALSRDIKSIAQLAISEALVAYPIYTLDDTDLQQRMAKSMLKSVRVQNSALVFELSPF